LLTSPTGHLTNLSRSPYEPRRLLQCDESEEWEGHDNGGASRAEASDLGNVSGLSVFECGKEQSPRMGPTTTASRSTMTTGCASS